MSKSKDQTKAVSAAPYEVAAQALQNYFDLGRVSAVADPWSRIVDGVVVEVHASKWEGFATLKMEHLGLGAGLDEALNRLVHAGQINLMDTELMSAIDGAISQARQLPTKWGIRVHWGKFVPLSALSAFQADFNAAKQRFDEAIEKFEANYDEYRKEAMRRVILLARQAWMVANAIQDQTTLDREEYADMDRFAAYLVQQLLQKYPTRDSLRGRYELSFDTSFIPTPELEAEQLAYAQRVRVETEQWADRRRAEMEREYADDLLAKEQALTALTLEQAKNERKREVLADMEKKQRASLRQQQAKIVKEFYEGWALEIRQRLHAALMLVMEGITTGKFKGPTITSLKNVIEVIEQMTLDDDTEIMGMVKTLRGYLQTPKAKAFSEPAVQQTIRDFGTLLQTSILMFDGEPRVPERLDREYALRTVPILAGLDDIRRVRERVGLDKSLAESLAEVPEFSNRLMSRRRGEAVIDVGDITDLSERPRQRRERITVE